jgi:hypothetical protein
MQLDPLEFQVKTEALSEAIDKIGVLQQAVQKLSKDTSSQSDLQVAKQTNAVIIENAKAQSKLIEIETKRLENQKKLNAAQDDTTEVTKKTNTVLERQTRIYENMIEYGLSKGQASTLAMAQAQNIAADSAQKLVEVMKDTRKFVGGDTFDKSTAGMVAMQNRYETLLIAAKNYAEGSALNIRQAQDLALDTERLAAKNQLLGISGNDATDSVNKMTTAFKALAIQENEQARANDAHAALIKKNSEIMLQAERERVEAHLNSGQVLFETNQLRLKQEQQTHSAVMSEMSAYYKDIEKQDAAHQKILDAQAKKVQVKDTTGDAATQAFIRDQEAKVKALARAEEMLARLDNKIKQSTAEEPLSQSAANQLFTYTKMLEKAGVAADVAKVKIDEFSKKQSAASALALADEEKKIKHLAASLAPQVTDVTVGLMTGQNPLTVFMQQGGQIRDQIGLSRVATEDLGKVFKLTITGMIDMVMAMGAALLKFMVSPMGLVLLVISAVVVGVVSFYEEMFKAEKQTLEIAKALEVFGNAAGLTVARVKELAKEASSVDGVSYDKAITSMLELSKTGEVSSEMFVEFSKNAVLFERYAGVGIAETAKQLKELGKEPLKAVMKISEETGFFTAAIIEQIAELERLGKKDDATALAQKALSDAQAESANRIKESLTGFSKVLDSVGNDWDKFWDRVKGRGVNISIQDKIDKIKAELKTLEFDKLNAGPGFTSAFLLDPAIKSRQQNLAAQEALLLKEGDLSKQQKEQKENAKTQGDFENLVNSVRIKPDKKAEDSAKAFELSNKLIIAAGSDVDQVQKIIDRRNKALHDIETGKKGDPKPKAVKDTLESLNLNLDNQTQQDEKQYQLRLRGIDNFTKQEQTRLQNSLTAKEITQGEFMVRELAMLASGENQKTALIDEQRITRANDLARDATTLTERYNEFVDANKNTTGFAEKNKDELEKLRSKVADLGRAYETSTIAMDEQASKAKELSKTLYDKQYAVLAGSIRSAKEELVKFTIAEDKLKEQRKTQVEVEDKLRYASPEQAAYIQASATETARLTTEVQKYNEEIRLQTENVNGAVNAGEKERELLGYITVDTQKLIDKQRELQAVKEQNRDSVAGTINSASSIAGNAAVVKLQKDNLKTLSDGIAASVETGLFEGGEAGAKSLRTLVEAELRKPITIFIRAVVSDLVNLVTGNTGSAGGSTLSTVNGISTAYNASGMLAGSYSAGSQYLAGTMSGANAAGTVGGNLYSGMGAGDGISGLLATNSAYGTTAGSAAGASAATGTMSSAIPYIGAFIAAVLILQQMGPTSARTLGSANAEYDASGKLLGTSQLDQFKTQEQVTQTALPTDTTDWQLNIRNAEANRSNKASAGTSEKQFTQASEQAKMLAAGYYKAAESLSIKTIAATFGFNSNTGNNGANPNVDFRVKAGGIDYNTGEISSTGSTEDKAAVTLGLSRVIVTALKASELPKYIAGVFDELTVNTATQKQIDDVMALAQTYKAFHDTLVLLPFENLKDMSYATAKALVEAAGGMEAFGTKLQSYYSNYYSAEEQKAQTIKNINSTLIGTGFDAATATRETFRKLVESQDVTTESGRKTYTALMNVSEAFAGITPALDSTTTSLKDLLDVVTKSANTAFTSLKASVDLEKTKATELYTTKLNAYNLALTSTTDSISKLTSLASALKSTLSSLNIINSDQQQRISAQADIKAALIQAQAGGGLPLNNELTTALSTITKPSEGLFSTFTEYARDFYKTSRDIQALSDLTGTQLTTEEQSLKAQKEQIALLSANHTAEIAKYDDMLTLAQAQLDAANGISNAVLSIADALAAFGGSLGKLSTERKAQGLPTTTTTGGTGTASSTTQAKYHQVYESYTGNISYDVVDPYEIARLDNINAAIQSVGAETPEAIKKLADLAKQYGVSMFDLSTASGYLYSDVQNLFASAGIPAFDVGTNYVPHDMLAQIHEGEAIIPKAYNPDANGMNAALVDEIRALRVQVQDLQASNRETAMSTRNTDKTLVRVTQGGEAMQTQVI